MNSLFKVTCIVEERSIMTLRDSRVIWSVFLCRRFQITYLKQETSLRPNMNINLQCQAINCQKLRKKNVISNASFYNFSANGITFYCKTSKANKRFLGYHT